MKRISLFITKTSFGKRSEHKETTQENGEFPLALPAVQENAKPNNMGGQITFWHHSAWALKPHFNLFSEMSTHEQLPRF